LIQGVALDTQTTASICKEAFRRGLVMETSGANDEVLKVLPPLTIQPDVLEDGLDRMYESAMAVVQRREARPPLRIITDFGATS